MTDLKLGDRVVLTNKETGQKLPEAEYRYLSSKIYVGSKVYVLFDGSSKRNGFLLHDWTIEKVAASDDQV